MALLGFFWAGGGEGEGRKEKGKYIRICRTRGHKIRRIDLLDAMMM